jgi:hypothetical protein
VECAVTGKQFKSVGIVKIEGVARKKKKALGRELTKRRTEHMERRSR